MTTDEMTKELQNEQSEIEMLKSRIAELENPLTFKNRDPSFEVWDKTYAKSFETKGLFILFFSLKLLYIFLAVYWHALQFPPL